MKKLEYEKFKGHILGSMEIEDLKANLETYSKICVCDTTYQRAKQLVQDGAFECYYDGVIDVLKTVYGDDSKKMYILPNQVIIVGRTMNAIVGQSISIRLH